METKTVFSKCGQWRNSQTLNYPRTNSVPRRRPDQAGPCHPPQMTQFQCGSEKRLRNILGKTPLEMCPFSRITLINGIYPLDKLNESSTVKFFFRCVKLFELKNGGELMQSFEIVRHFLFILQEHENEFPFLFFRNMKIVSFLFCRKMQINSAYDEINPRHKMNLTY